MMEVGLDGMFALFYLTKKEVSEWQVKKVNVGPEEKYLDR